MAEKMIVIYFFTLVLAATIEAQFFDFFSDLRPFTYQTVKPVFQETTSRRTKPNQKYNGDEYRPYDAERDRNTQTTREKARRKTTTVSYESQFATQKPRRFKNVTRNEYSNNDNNRNYGNNDNNYDYNNRRPESNVIDYATRPYDTTRNSKYTTYNPLYNRPGVKPAVVDSNKPPITNRPATQRPLAVYPRPTDASVIRFPEGSDGSPPVISGPDVDSMSSAERRRYLQIAEKMCDKYKALNVKKLEFIPLLPSPESVQINVTDCEVPSVPLVVGGRVASVREFPHMALLGWTKIKGGGYSWKCGGSLVSDQYVLTAAHCSFQNRDMEVVSGAPRVVQLGSSYLDDPGALVVKVSTIVRHPKYMQSRSYYDIALVKLVKPVTFSAVVKPACLGEPPPAGAAVVATGWGRTEFGGDQSLELRSVSVPIWDLNDCRRILGVTRKMPNGPSADSQVCAGEKNGGKDTCQGDSGGPAQIQDGCLWRIVAVTSVGRSCGAVNTPAVYAKVFREFIAAQIYKDQSNDNNDYGSNNQNSGSHNDYGYNNENSGSNNRDHGYNNQNSGSNNRDNGYNNQNSGSNNRDYGYNNQNSGSNNRNTNSHNFGTSFDNSRPSFNSNNDNNRRNRDNNDYSNNNGQNNNYDRNRQSNLYNNANNRQTGNNYDRNQQNNNNYGGSQQINDYNNRQSGNNYNNQSQVYSNQVSNNRNINNDYNNHNVNRQSTTNNYERQNVNRYNNNGMIEFNSQNSYSTNKPSTINYFGSNKQDYYNPINNYRKRDDYRVSDDGDDIIYWPEA